MEKIGEQQTDTDNLRLLECAWNVAQWNMGGNECDRDFSAGQTHREIFHAAALGEKFRLSGELETGCVHARLVNRAGHDGIEFTAPSERDRFLQRRSGRASSFKRRLA